MLLQSAKHHLYFAKLSQIFLDSNWMSGILIVGDGLDMIMKEHYIWNDFKVLPYKNKLENYKLKAFTLK